MYAREIGSETFTFDFAEGLVKNNLLIVDRESNSIWSQLDNKAISGPMKDTPLEVIPSMQTTWKHWRELYSDTEVMFVEGEKGRAYIYRNWKPGTPRPKERPKEHDTSNLGLGVVVNNQALYFPFGELAKTATPLEMEIGGKSVVINYKNDALTAWAEDANGNLLAGVLAYQDGWLDFFPESEIFNSEISKKQ